MILAEEELQERIESPLNLLNRLRNRMTPRSSHSIIPSLPPTSNEIIENLEEKINYGSAKSKAAAIMTLAMDELKTKLNEVTRPKELAAIAESMGKIIANTQVRHEDNKTQAQIIVYAPMIVNEDHYDIVDVRETERE